MSGTLKFARSKDSARHFNRWWQGQNLEVQLLVNEQEGAVLTAPSLDVWIRFLFTLQQQLRANAPTQLRYQLCRHCEETRDRA